MGIPVWEWKSLDCVFILAGEVCLPVVCVCVCLHGEVHGYMPFLPLLVSPQREGGGILCVCVCVCMCVCFSSFYPGLRCEGTRVALIFPGWGAQEQVGMIAKEPLFPLHPAYDPVICLLPPTVVSLGSQMLSLCSPPTTE